MKYNILTATLLLVFNFSFGQSEKHQYSHQLDELNLRIAQDPQNLSLYYTRAEVYDLSNDFTNAIRDYQRVVEMYRKEPDEKYLGEYAKSCYHLADDYFFRNHNREQALKYVKKGLQVTQNFKDLEVMEAILTGFDTASLDLAKNKYATLSAKYPDDIRLSFYYAKFLEKIDPLLAAEQYAKIIAADPFNKEALISAATIYNNEAHKLSTVAVNDTKKVYDLAKKASVYFEKLYKLNPADKEVANVLRMLYDEMNEQEKAKMMNLPY
ncbi:MAG TPA: hypothetical protein VNJ07_02120 [Chitinophagales bacterium]|nr:hypothetical protein [Chitinophagales bacterium]